MLGNLYVVGIGPGDPELLTLKAARIIRAAQVLCVPKGREEGSSLALSIVEKAVDLDGKEIIEAHFPMMKTRMNVGARCRVPLDVVPHDAVPQDADLRARGRVPLLDDQWGKIAEMILGKLRSGFDVVFPTLGDPTIYSTFFYLYGRLLEMQPDLNIEIIPGVSSINASAARAGISLGLGNEKIAVLPANYMDNLRDTLETFDTVVLMKVNKVLNEIVTLLDDMGLLTHAVCVSRAGMEDEKIFKDIRDIQQEKLNYFSMIIVRK